MVEQALLGYEVSRVPSKEVKFEEDEEDFRSCCEDEDELKEREESVKENLNDFLDEFSVKMFFKGVSTEPGDPVSSGLSGIGVFMERSANFPAIQIQKKLDFFVEESVADYLALMDGLSEAMSNNIKHVFAFTDSQILFDQITSEETVENSLIMALRQRIFEQASDLESFVVKLIPKINLERPLQLAQVAIGIVSLPSNGDNKSTENCSICCEEKLSHVMITLKCSHKFCSHCMKTYVDGKVQSSQVPIRCPQLKCKYKVSANECKSFLPVTSYESLKRALEGANIFNSGNFYCPYSNCSALIDPSESTRASSSTRSESSCVECTFCERFICVECGVPWHSSMSCEEYQNLPVEERDSGDLSLHQLAENKRWRRCQQCRSMIELTHGCYHITCWCGHEFCYSCGAEYRDGQQACQCMMWDEDAYAEEEPITHPAQQFEQWAWDSFGSLSTMMDAYTEQERSQLALIQRFLAGGFSLSDHNTCQSPPRCTDPYVDTMKDLRQLPWLERFVSVISDDFYDDYTQ